jgi:RNA 3'-terminal phosphate cyclase (ATP)
MAPPVDFLRDAFLPVLSRIGGHVEIAFERHGFYPAGGGAWSAVIHPATQLSSLDLRTRGEVRHRRATALVAHVPSSVAVREIEALVSALGWERGDCRPRVVEDSQGPGNVLVAVVESEHVTEIVTGFGERGIRAEAVAQGVAAAVARYLRAGVPVGEHLADQLLLPMALGRGGMFRTLRPSEHCRTQASLLQLFLGVSIELIEHADQGTDVWTIKCRK